MLYLGIKELIHWAECLECLERPSVTILFVPEGLGQAAKGGRMPSRQEIDVVLTNYVANRCRF